MVGGGGVRISETDTEEGSRCRWYRMVRGGRNNVSFVARKIMENFVFRSFDMVVLARSISFVVFPLQKVL